MSKKSLIFSCLVGFILTACGGGGGGSSTSSAPAIPAPTATVSASAANAIKGDTLTITWSSTNATSCTASGSWSGSLATSGSQTVTASTTGAATYGISCAGGGGSASAEAKVTVVDKATATISSSATNAMKGDTVTLTWSSTSTSGCTASGGWSGSIAASGSQAVSVGSTGSVPFTISCNGPGGTATAETKINAYERVAINLALSRTDVITYQASTLTWSVANADSCTASGAWSGTKALTGSLTIPTTAEASNTYELSCANAGGSVKQSVNLKVSKPTLSVAGTWVPVAEANITAKNGGSLANTFNGIVRIGSSGQYGVTVIGWSYTGFGNQASTKTVVPVNATLLVPDSGGLLSVATDRLKPDAVTNGGGSVVVADFNGDSYDDIVMLAHNESPFQPAPSTVFWGSASGTFTKETLADKVMAHDAQLVIVDGQKRIFSGTFSSGQEDSGAYVKLPDAMVNPIYAFTNGKLLATEPPRIKAAQDMLPGVGGMTNTYIRGTSNYSARFVAGDSNVPNASGQCCETRVSIFGFSSGDIISPTPTQSFMPYLGTLDAYKSYASIGGQAPHTYRVYGKDLNQDGHDDILVAQSYWTQANNNWPSALQIMLNDGNGYFSDATAKLNPDMSLAKQELGYTPKFIDLDGSGIESMLWDGSRSYNDYSRHSDYLILNDGTGRLYLALHPEFDSISLDVYAYLKSKNISGADSTPARLIGVPQTDGSINFLAETQAGSAPTSTNLPRSVYTFVNVPLKYNPKTDFTKNIAISDRNNSQRIRTWAGDDTISDKNAAKATTIDGGLGANKVTYSGPSTAYSVVKNADGTTTVTATVSGSYPSVKDTLKNIQTIQFTDKSVALGARVRAN